MKFIAKQEMFEKHIFNVPLIQGLKSYMYTKKHLKKKFCLFGVFHPTEEFFTHLETALLPLKGCKFSPMLSTDGH